MSSGEERFCAFVCVCWEEGGWGEWMKRQKISPSTWETFFLTSEENTSTLGWHIIENHYLGGRDAQVFTTILCYEASLPKAAIPSHIQVT